VRVPPPQNIGRLSVNIDLAEQTHIRRMIGVVASNPPPDRRERSVTEALRRLTGRMPSHGIGEPQRRWSRARQPFDPTPSETH